MPAFDFGPRFSLGHISVTKNALAHVPFEEIRAALRRHERGDWGEVDEPNGLRNEVALKRSGRLLSAYQASTGVRFWIVTELGRSQTTVMMPEDD